MSTSQDVKRLNKELAALRKQVADLKQAEATLKEQVDFQQGWRRFLEAMTHPAMIIDPKRNIIDVNEAAVKVMDKRRAQIVGQKCFGIHKMTRPPENCPLSKTLKSRHSETVEMEIKILKGTFLISCAPIFDKNGAMEKILHIVINITERKQLEKKLSESEERYRHLFEQCPIGIGLSSIDGKVMYGNKAMESMTGYTSEELKKLNLADTYVNLAERKVLRNTLRRLGNVVNFPVRLKRKDGTQYDALLNISRIIIDDNVFFHTICQDITERKKKEDIIRASEEKVRMLIESTNDILAYVDRQGKVIEIYGDLEDVIGYRPDEVKGKRLWQLGFSDKKNLQTMVNLFVNAVKRGNLRTMKGKEANIMTVEFTHREGSKVFLEANTRVVKKDGKLAGFMSVVRDITDRKHAEDALRISEEKYRLLFENANDAIYLHEVSREGPRKILRQTKRPAGCLAIPAKNSSG